MRVVLLAAALCVSLAMTAATEQPSRMVNIQPLQAKDADTGELANGCTAWATRVNGFLKWVTAFHCVGNRSTGELAERDYHIAGVPAHPAFGNPVVDLLAFEGGPDVGGLKVAKDLPALVSGRGSLVKVWAAGFPFGVNEPWVTAGVLSAPVDDEDLAVFDLSVAPGGSGSPVLIGWSVVGVLQRSVCDGRGFCSVSRGATLRNLRRFLYGE